MNRVRGRLALAGLLAVTVLAAGGRLALGDEAKFDAAAIEPSRRGVFSTTVGRLLTVDDDLRELLASQLVKPVLFAQSVDSNTDVDLWIEVGPGDLVFAGVNALHGYSNPGSEPVGWIEMQAPNPPISNAFFFKADWDSR